MQQNILKQNGSKTLFIIIAQLYMSLIMMVYFQKLDRSSSKRKCPRKLGDVKIHKL